MRQLETHQIPKRQLQNREVGKIAALIAYQLGRGDVCTEHELV